MPEPTTEMPANVHSWPRCASLEPLAGAETILFVEDEAFVRDVTCEVLRTAGYQVLTAQNAAEGIRIFEARHADIQLLLTDVVLPGESGRVMAERLRRGNPELRVLLVTGYGEQMGQRAAAQEECLAKPFSAEALLRRVRGTLDGDVTAQKMAADAE
jgi:two-component system, cell cycle sensor histidine kinase and response regulator CckA